MKQARTIFTGTIKFVSLSPHGDPEGIVLSGGEFIKIPPHSLLDKKLLKVGAKVSGEGELINREPNQVFHHVQVKVGSRLTADDSMNEDKKEKLKERHKAEMKDRPHPADKALKVKGVLIAVATKPKGEVDRMIFEDGTSVHIPKELEIEAGDCELGSEVIIRGQSRSYGEGRFIKAEAVEFNRPSSS